jgi:hypothetical protein
MWYVFNDLQYRQYPPIRTIINLLITKLNIWKFNSYLKVNTARLYCKDKLINYVLGNIRWLFRESYETHKYALWEKIES